jgi:type III pantothenate kinase
VIPTIVVDVGNTWIKWGRCDCQRRVLELTALPPDAPDAWLRQLEQWYSQAPVRWILTGVHPERRDTLARWLRQRGATVQTIDSYRQLPLDVLVEAPEKVGIDRLLNAVAANTRRPPGSAAVIVDAGSAVTVDIVDPAGVFRGGAIFPGARLMAQALHQFTALLPPVRVDRAEQPPGTSTAHAICVGIYHAVHGGVGELVAAYRRQYRKGIVVFITGGDGALLTAADPTLGESWPEMTLEGILHSAAGAPLHE